MKKTIVLIATLAILGFSACTENQRAKNFGGTAEITLPKGKKLVNATWKETSLWYLTRDMKPEEKAEIYNFSEESSWGIIQGGYIIKEQK